MKKITAAALALILLFVLSLPVFAENESSGNTTVTYSVGTSYTISIPSAVTIGATGTGKQLVKVNAGSVVPADKQLEFKITASDNYLVGTGFRLVNDLDANVFLNYSIEFPTSQSIDDLTTVFLTANAAAAYAGSQVELTYTITDTAQSAGSYSDGLTFSVSLEDAA